MRQENLQTEYSFNGARLSSLRDGRTKTYMARQLGVSVQVWHYYETGGWPSVKVLARIMDRFGLSFSDLVEPVNSNPCAGEQCASPAAQ